MISLHLEYIKYTYGISFQRGQIISRRRHIHHLPSCSGVGAGSGIVVVPVTLYNSFTPAGESRRKLATVAPPRNIHKCGRLNCEVD